MEPPADIGMIWYEVRMMSQEPAAMGVWAGFILMVFLFNLDVGSTFIETDDLVYSVNEWDNYAVEEAIQIRDRVGGMVTVATVGDEEAEEVLRREMAMGADNGLLLCDDAFEDTDGKGIASLLKAAVQKGNYDLILSGAQADGGAAHRYAFLLVAAGFSSIPMIKPWMTAAMPPAMKIPSVIRAIRARPATSLGMIKRSMAMPNMIGPARPAKVLTRTSSATTISCAVYGRA